LNEYLVVANEYVVANQAQFQQSELQAMQMLRKKLQGMKAN